ncbi:hypothetical protein [Maridesulfovibrio sp.]|uniref:hypothetical protein n=1 Tax=Maridesulfovibrio sp. TaxID=2795000 RepID=UPI0029CA401D|nr:hypothetical protein [Maridesulfovibrio sp.]
MIEWNPNMFKDNKFLNCSVVAIAVAFVTCIGFLNVMSMMGVYDIVDGGNYIAAGVSSLLENKLMPIGIEYRHFIAGDTNFQSSLYPAPLLQFFLAITSGGVWGNNVTFSSAALFACIPVFIFNFFFFLTARKHCKISILGSLGLLSFFNFTPLAYSIYRPIGEPFLLAAVFVAIFLIFENRHFWSGATLAIAYFFRVQALPFIPSLFFLFIKDKKRLIKYMLGALFFFVLGKLLLFTFGPYSLGGSEKFYSQAYNNISLNFVDGFIYFVKSRPALLVLFSLNFVILSLCKDDTVKKINLLCINCFCVMFLFLYCYALFKIKHVPGRYVVYYFPISTLGVASFCQYFLSNHGKTHKLMRVLPNFGWGCLAIIVCVYCLGFNLSIIRINLQMVDSDQVFNRLPVTKDDIVAVTDKSIRSRVYFTFMNRNLVCFQDFKRTKSEKKKPRSIINGPSFFVGADNSEIDYLFVGGLSDSWLKFIEGKDEISDKFGNRFKLVASKVAKRELSKTIAYKVYSFLCVSFPEEEKNIYSFFRKFDLLPRDFEIDLYHVYKRVVSGD